MAEGDEGRRRDDDGQRVVPADEVSKIVSEAVNRATSPLKDQITSLETKVNASVQTNKETTQYTRAQLAAAVENEKISQAEADAIFDKQQDQRVQDTTISIINQNTQEQRIQGNIDKYKEFDADLNDSTSDAYRQVASEVAEQCQLLNLEAPTLALELNALKSVYGPVSRLKPNQRDRQTHQDISTNEGNDKPGDVTLNDDGSPKGLSKDEKIYYQDLINKKIYSDWKQVEEEMKHADSRLRNRVAGRS